ncbi:MAG: GNAT family N-acetyltransferase [Candidatus Eremiobacteraeota bacterium]|nr:GNAT family N-acetyltransferase [Candidatus Eremiobacteraeota bacterium]
MTKRLSRHARQHGDIHEYLSGRGAFWLALRDRVAIGCIATRPLETVAARICEVKRLYGRSDHRGEGIAHGLYAALEAFASSAGFRWIYLDTNDGMRAAIRFYERHGFERCERYNENPQATLFMRKPLIADVTPSDPTR